MRFANGLTVALRVLNEFITNRECLAVPLKPALLQRKNLNGRPRLRAETIRRAGAPDLRAAPSLAVADLLRIRPRMVRISTCVVR
jgi:hypothetical protein